MIEDSTRTMDFDEEVEYIILVLQMQKPLLQYLIYIELVLVLFVNRNWQGVLFTSFPGRGSSRGVLGVDIERNEGNVTAHNIRRCESRDYGNAQCAMSYIYSTASTGKEDSMLLFKT